MQDYLKGDRYIDIDIDRDRYIYIYIYQAVNNLKEEIRRGEIEGD